MSRPQRHLPMLPLLGFTPVDELPPVAPKTHRAQPFRKSKTVRYHQSDPAQTSLGALAEGITEPRHLPLTRGDCAEARGYDEEGKLNPCPYVSCRSHLYLDVDESNRSIRLNFPNLEVWEFEHTCALDIAEEGENSLETVGAALNITRQGAQIIEHNAVAQIVESRASSPLRDYKPDGPARAGNRRVALLTDDEDDEQDCETWGGDAPAEEENL